MTSRSETTLSWDDQLSIALAPRQQVPGDVWDEEPIGHDQSHAVLDVLADADFRAIIAATANQQLPVSDLVERCDIPTATAYRKVNHLVEIGLLDNQIQIRSTGRNRRVFSLRVPQIRAGITADGNPEVTFAVRASADESTGAPSAAENGSLSTVEDTRDPTELSVNLVDTDDSIETQRGDDQSRWDTSVSNYVTEIVNADDLDMI
jgi:hypothetical protein